MAVPERDLWMVVKDADDLARYADATGRAPDMSALALYRLRWDLEDIAVFLDWFQSPHVRSPDTEQGWNELVKLADRVPQIGENIPLDGEDA